MVQKFSGLLAYSQGQIRREIQEDVGFLFAVLRWMYQGERPSIVADRNDQNRKGAAGLQDKLKSGLICFYSRGDFYFLREQKI